MIILNARNLQMGAQYTDRALCDLYSSVWRLRSIVEYTAVITWLFDIYIF